MAKHPEVPDYIQASIPFFILFVIVEVTVSVMSGRKFYRLHDTISSLTAGLVMMLLNVFLDAVGVFPYEWIYQNYALVNIPKDSIGGWIAAFLGVDLAYYWFHRAGHRVNIGWATHAPHHSSEDYNLSTALRQGCVQILFSFVFNLPMAFFIPVQLYLAHRQWNTIYQFWIHTKSIGKLGFLEYIINTPSHHRVHHARNPQYIDKNYAGTLIIWDRMFGTFEEEHEEVAYGLVHNLDTWDALYAQYHHLWHIFSSALKAPNISTAFHIVFDSPAWTPEGELSVPPVKASKVVAYDTTLPFGLNAYVIVSFLFAVAESLAVLGAQEKLGWRLAAVYVIYCIMSLACVGFLMDANVKAKYLEIARHFITIAWFVAIDPVEIPNNFKQVIQLSSLVSICWVLMFYSGYCKKSKRIPSHEKSD